jgi:hypothetical protein
LDGLAGYLTGRGVGIYTPDEVQSADWGIFLDFEPSSPERTITLFKRPGGESFPGQPWEECLIEIRVRGDRNADTSRAKAIEIYSMLNGLSYVALPDSNNEEGVWLSDSQSTSGGVVPTGTDANNLRAHSVFLRVSTEYPTENRPTV